VKANALQTLTMKSAANGSPLTGAALISKGDRLIVLSGDSLNTSTYTLDVSAIGLSNNTLLSSTKFTINATGTTGTIAGFSKNTLLKTILAGVVVPSGATLTMTDENDAYMSLIQLNFDTTYVNVIATDKIYFDVIAEDGITRTSYQLKQTTNPSEAYVTSDVFSVNQFACLINFVPNCTSVTSLLSNVIAAPGATLAIFDKAGYVRTEGDVYRDDKVIVTAADGKTTKAYYLSMLTYKINYYFAYVISDDYQVEQMKRIITGPTVNTSIAEFKNKLYTSFGATLKVINKNGVESTLTNLAIEDKLLVTAADGTTTALYTVKALNSSEVVAGTSSIKMYPNPSTGRVIVQGLAKGNRVQVVNAAGVVLRDVIVENSTDYVSLESHPAGIYIFVISAGTQHINIQKIVKK